MTVALHSYCQNLYTFTNQSLEGCAIKCSYGANHRRKTVHDVSSCDLHDDSHNIIQGFDHVSCISVNMYKFVINRAYIAMHVM